MRYVKNCIAVVFIIIITTFALPQKEDTGNSVLKRDDGSIIQYYLELNNVNDVSNYLLVIIQGSDCNSVKHNKSVKKLWKIFPRADLLTVEKYGITDSLVYSDSAERKDCPKEYLYNDNPELRADDLKKVIDYLRNKYRYQKIVVIGDSEGAVVAEVLTKNIKYVDATILFGIGGRWSLDNIIYSLQFAFSSQEDLEKKTDEIKQFAQKILSGEPFEISMGDHGYRWWKSMLSIDNQSILESIETPVLMIQGEKDKTASPVKAKEMAEYLQNQGKQNIDYICYDYLDYSLNLSTGNELPKKTLVDIIDWLIRKI